MLSEILPELRRCTSPAVNSALPAKCYTDESFLELEIQTLFVNQWQCVGRVDEVAMPGDYFTTQIVSGANSIEPIVVVRDKNNTINALSNVCRHRGMPVASGCGNRDTFKCPYHAWTYHLDGRLRSAPLINKSELHENTRLPVLATSIWQGFIFVNADENAVAPWQALNTLHSQIVDYHIEDFYHIDTFEEQWECNWKCLVENFMDAYHLSVVHKETLRHLTPTKLCEKLGHDIGWTAYAANYPKNAPRRLQHHPSLTTDQQHQSRLFCIFPGLLVSISADTTVYLSLQPNGANKVNVKWGLSSYESDLSVEEKRERTTKWQAINAEDHAILKRLQLGIESKFYQPGPLAADNIEGSLKDFHYFLAQSLCIDENQLTA